jgi:hypothetical protein
VTAVTPGSLAALALLSDERRSVSHEELLFRCRRLLRVLISMDARVTPRTAVNGELREESIQDAVQMFVDAELLETHRPGDFPADQERRMTRTGIGALYRVPERKRIELDVTKNIIVHFFVARSLLSIAALMRNGPDLACDTARERLRELAELFKYEFRLRSDRDYDALFNETLNSMQSAGELELFPDGRLDVGGLVAHVRRDRSQLRGGLSRGGARPHGVVAWATRGERAGQAHHRDRPPHVFGGRDRTARSRQQADLAERAHRVQRRGLRAVSREQVLADHFVRERRRGAHDRGAHHGLSRVDVRLGVMTRGG